MKNETIAANLGTTEKLLAIAAEGANLSAPDVLYAVLAPDWKSRSGLDWEPYVPRALRELWQGLVTDAKLSAFIMASQRAQEAGLTDHFDCS